MYVPCTLQSKAEPEEETIPCWDLTTVEAERGGSALPVEVTWCEVARVGEAGLGGEQ